ncbi:hypothetical protein I5S62_03475 [Pseudomonas putida]|uniref:Uncharacterized protein n=2 Tax=Pseudomonas TaxID=286 RepID=A0A2S3XGH9_PSEPU|nr:hypothetical protein C4Q28_17665 [Pseudomonas sp. SWI6]AVD94960.1 hypothetical protein C4Q27_22450 [Pseudomonas sp. SWI36]ELU0816634.1 hypothetical protein [Pseudomonas putida]PTC01578.1 hypothetical protein C9975_01400 [Thalassospira xiamenensis]MBH3388181.1 hypothetical protein [Pseudomonas putida]
MKRFSDAVVLSPGVWQQFIAPATGEEPIGQSAMRLADLLNRVLNSVPRTSHCPIELQLDYSRRNGTSVSAHLPQLQLARITPHCGPVFLLIRLPGEIVVDIAAL